MLQVTLLALMGHCHHLTLNLLALSARMLQVAPLARMVCCARLFLTLMARMLQLVLLARMGHGPHLTLILLSPSDSDPDGTMSPFISDPAGLDDPYVTGGPVGPYGTLSPSDSGSAILVDPGGVLLLGEEGPGSVPTDDLVSVAAVPLPAVRDLMVAQSPVEGLVRECEDVTEESITVHDGWSDPEVVRTPAVVAMLGMNALPIRNDAPLDCVDDGTAWIADNGDQYDFDVPEGMDLMVFERGREPSGSVMLDYEGTGVALVCQTTLSDPQCKLETGDVDPLANVFNGTLSGNATVGSPTFRSGGGLETDLWRRT